MNERMKAMDGWIDRWRERGPGCATSCLDQLLPSSVHIERHSEDHGCLWKCLCELLPGRKYLRSFTVWHLKSVDWIQQVIIIYLSPSPHAPCFCSGLFSHRQRLYWLHWVSSHSSFYEKLEWCVFISLLAFKCVKSPFVSVRGEFKFPRAAAVVALCVTVRNYHKTDWKPRPE